MNVIGGVKPGGGGVNPIMMETLRRTTPKRLGGGREEFQEWQGLWEDHLRVARVVSPGGLCDFSVLTMLKEWLDDSKKKELETRMRRDKGLCYYEFYRELCKKFCYDRHTVNRNKW